MSPHGWREWLDTANNLIPDQRAAHRSAIADSTLECWKPDARSVKRLAQFSSGATTFTEYRATVLDGARVGLPATRTVIDEADIEAKHYSP